MTGNGPITAGPWTLRLHPRGAYHRVDGATYNVAIVKRREDALAIALLPEALGVLNRLAGGEEPGGLAVEAHALIKKAMRER